MTKMPPRCYHTRMDHRYNPTFYDIVVKQARWVIRHKSCLYELAYKRPGEHTCSNCGKTPTVIKAGTLVQVGSRGKDFEQKIAGKEVTKTDISKMVGELLAEQAKEKGVTKVVFDRKGYLFHGRVKALAEAARGKGLVF